MIGRRCPRCGWAFIGRHCEVWTREDDHFMRTGEPIYITPGPAFWIFAFLTLAGGIWGASGFPGL